MRYFEFDIKIKYNHSRLLKTVKTKKSDRIPNVNILIISKPENEACVMGWNNNTILKMRLTSM
ncbi:hypothetical protein GENT11_15840 [Flavobacterium ammonificans]|uniref:Uncharacterized protein n=1 Tax=Flavobacterium ammonificans TaxID=1751056 RepID=A0ABM7UZG4_9FLAO|nr:hypothetical protein GENT11_15840 [Flavobacterium ammonificans]